MDNRLPVLLLCIAALVLAAVSLLRLAQGMATQSIELYIVTAAVLLAAVVCYLIYRSKNTRE